MESLKSHLGLRSMDMEGRSLGTERPSVSTGTGDGRPASGRFLSFLQSRTSEAAGGTARRTQASMEDDVAERIRGGRTDAADAGPQRPDAPERDQRGARETEGDARDVGRRPEQRSDSDRPRADRSNRAEQGNERGADGPELSSRERAIGWTDASDAHGSDETDAHEGEALAAPVLPPVQQNGPARTEAGHVAAATLHPTSVGSAVGGAFAPGAARGGAGGVAPAGAAQPGAAPTLRAESATQASRTQAAAPKPGAAAMERAEAILDQLRMRIRAGDREATIQLRPADLGRLQMHVRVDGGAISATIAAESAETLAVLEAHAPELRSWLARDDGQRVDLQLELLAPSDAEDHAAREQADQRRKGGRGGSAQRDADASLAAAPDALTRTLARHAADGGVDLVA